MAFDMGFNCRGTSGFVTDPAYGVPCLAESFPHTYTASNGYSINAGFTTGAPSGSNRSSSIDVRLAGVALTYGATATLKVDLASGSAPGAGTYTVDGAWGDENQGLTSISVAVKDNTTTLTSFGPVSPATAHFYDVTGTDRAPGSGTWNGATSSLTFATTTAIMTVGGATYAGLAHFRLTLGGGSGAPYTLTAAVGALSLSGKTARTLVARRLTAAKGTAAMTGRVANLRAGRRLTGAKGTLGLTGRVASLRATRRLTALTGTFGLTGSATGLRVARRLVGAPGSLTLTGQPALRGIARRLLATTGTLALLGPDVTITKGGVLYRLTAATGTLTVTGVDAAVLRAGRLLAAQGAFTLTGRAARLRYVTAGGDFHHERRDTTQPFRRHWT